MATAPHHLYTGQINDGDTGLYYYNARYYDPALHRFIQADTIVPDPNNPQSLNRFSYVRNNPVRYNDPTGHCEGDPTNGADADCWGAYQVALDMLGFSPHLLHKWSLDELLNLLAWIDRGVIFQNSESQWTGANIADVISGLDRIYNALGEATYDALGLVGNGTLTFAKLAAGHPNGIGGNARGSLITIYMPNNHHEWVTETAIHEMGHVIDRRAGSGTLRFSYSDEWLNAGDWSVLSVGYEEMWYIPATAPYGPSSTYGGEHPREDFAETFTWYVERKNGLTRDRRETYPSPERQAALSTALSQFQ